MAVPKSLKLAEAELSSLAQLGHQLAAAARPGMSIRELLHQQAAAIGPPDQDRDRERAARRGER